MRVLLVTILILATGFTLPKPPVRTKRLVANRALAGQLMAPLAPVQPAKTNLLFTWDPIFPPVAANLQMSLDLKTWTNMTAVDTSTNSYKTTNGIILKYPKAFFRLQVPYR